MSDKKTVARYYRAMVLDLCMHATKPPIDASDTPFRTCLERNYDELREQLVVLTATGVPEQEIYELRVPLYIYAAALLTYGRLDVAEDIVMGIPKGGGSIRLLARALRALLPLPEGLDSLTDRVAVQQWLRQNAESCGGMTIRSVSSGSRRSSPSSMPGTAIRPARPYPGFYLPKGDARGRSEALQQLYNLVVDGGR